jgi:hypothetical protein
MMIMIIVFLVVIAIYIILAFCIFKASSIDDCPSCDKFFNYKENDK